LLELATCAPTAPGVMRAARDEDAMREGWPSG
jgi:hypothetical protein